MPAATPIQRSPFPQRKQMLKDPTAPTVPNLNGPGANGQTGGPGMGGSATPPALASTTGPTGPPVPSSGFGGGGGIQGLNVNQVNGVANQSGGNLPPSMNFGGGGEGLKGLNVNQVNNVANQSGGNLPPSMMFDSLQGVPSPSNVLGNQNPQQMIDPIQNLGGPQQMVDPVQNWAQQNPNSISNQGNVSQGLINQMMDPNNIRNTNNPLNLRGQEAVNAQLNGIGPDGTFSNPSSRTNQGVPVGNPFDPSLIGTAHSANDPYAGYGGSTVPEGGWTSSPGLSSAEAAYPNGIGGVNGSPWSSGMYSPNSVGQGLEQNPRIAAIGQQQGYNPLSQPSYGQPVADSVSSNLFAMFGQSSPNQPASQADTAQPTQPVTNQPISPVYDPTKPYSATNLPQGATLNTGQNDPTSGVVRLQEGGTDPLQGKYDPYSGYTPGLFSEPEKPINPLDPNLQGAPQGPIDVTSGYGSNHSVSPSQNNGYLPVASNEPTGIQEYPNHAYPTLTGNVTGNQRLNEPFSQGIENAGGSTNLSSGGYQNLAGQIIANNQLPADDPNRTPDDPRINYARGTGVPYEEFVAAGNGSYIPDPNRWEQVNGVWQLKPGIIGRGTGNNSNNFNNPTNSNGGGGSSGGSGATYGTGESPSGNVSNTGVGTVGAGGVGQGSIVNIKEADPLGNRGESQTQSVSNSTNQSTNQSLSNSLNQSQSSNESGSQSNSSNQSQSQSNVLHTFDPSQARSMLGGDLAATQRPENAYTRAMMEGKANSLDALAAIQAQNQKDSLLGSLGARGMDTRSLGAGSLLSDIDRQRFASQLGNRRQMESDWANIANPFNQNQRSQDIAERGQDQSQNSTIASIINSLLGQSESQSMSEGGSNASSFGLGSSSSLGQSSSESQGSSLGTSNSQSLGQGWNESYFVPQDDPRFANYWNSHPEWIGLI